MTVGELKEMLEDVDDDVEVRLAIQPRWAFEYSVCGTALVDLNEPDLEDFEDPADVPQEWDKKEVLYIGEGSQLGYLPGVAADAVWR